MRLIGAILAACLIAVPALAQTAAPKAKAATPAPAPTQGPKEHYAALPDTERMAMQSDLVWTGDYNGLVNGDFTDRSLRAVLAYQKRTGGKDTGILNPQERSALAAAAKKAQERVGWRTVTDAAGMRLGIPGKIAPQSAPGKTGTRWSAAQGTVQIETFRMKEAGLTLASVFEQIKKEPPDRKVEYSLLRPEFFVVTGLVGLKKYYVRAEFKNDEVRGMNISYDQAMDGTMMPVIIAMSSAFAPFPVAVAAPAGPAPKRKVEYGTGVVVSAEGHILTGQQTIDGCNTVLVAGFGDAERIAEDKGADLALLRVYGASALQALAPSADAAGDSAITMVGIADPQAQNGGAAVTRIASRISAAQALASEPPAGFAGAAALDAQGRMIGVVAAKTPQSVLVSGDTVGKFLAAQGVRPTAAATDPAAAVVRVICVRK